MLGGKIEKSDSLISYLEIAQKAARRAGGVLSDRFSTDAGVLSELKKDIKTQADLEAEKIIFESLSQTGLMILSEEEGMDKRAESGSVPEEVLSSAGPIWIVDPLDGTYNFTRGFPFCCVSIALWASGKPCLGVVFDFLNGDIYCGSAGLGATCNGKPILVSPTSKISQSCLATGFPTGRNFDSESLLKSVSQFQSYKKVRMIGSAAMSLVNVASGKFDAYYEEGIRIWDVAAGLAIVAAAGGKNEVSGVNESWQVDVLASNGRLQAIGASKG